MLSYTCDAYATTQLTWLVSTNSVKATAEQPTNNGYWLQQYTMFMGNIEVYKVHLMHRTHGKEPQQQISSSVYPQPVLAAATPAPTQCYW